MPSQYTSKPWEIYAKATARAPGYYGNLAGAGPGAVGNSILGGLAGLGIGAGIGAVTGNKKTKWHTALLGAGAGALGSLPDVGSTIAAGRSLKDPFPFKAAAVKQASSGSDYDEKTKRFGETGTLNYVNYGPKDQDGFNYLYSDAEKNHQGVLQVDPQAKLISHSVEIEGKPYDLHREKEKIRQLMSVGKPVDRYNIEYQMSKKPVWDADLPTTPTPVAAKPPLLQRLRQVFARSAAIPVKTAGDKSWTGLQLDPEARQKVLSLTRAVDSSDLYTAKQDHGRESHPHITTLYGLTTTNPEEVDTHVRGFGPIEASLGRLDTFEKPEYDVLKMNVRGSGVKKLNKHLSKLPNEDTKRFKPHVTLAYLRKGTSHKYLKDNPLHGHKLKFNELSFSPPGTPMTQARTIPLHKDDDSVTRSTKSAGWDSMGPGVPPNTLAQDLYQTQLPREQMTLRNAATMVMADPTMNVAQRAVAFNALTKADDDKNGLFTVGDLARGAMGAGMGYVGGRLFGKLMGAAFGTTPNTQKRLGQAGAIGGLLNAIGVLR